jgi:uncharacterized Zn-finger protein
LLKKPFCIFYCFFQFFSIHIGTTKITTQILECSLCDKNFYLGHSTFEHYLIPVTKDDEQLDEPIDISNDDEYDNNVEQLETNDSDADPVLPQIQCTEPMTIAQLPSKNYHCFECDKSFVRLKSYQAHILKHSTESNATVVQSPTPLTHKDSSQVENVGDIMIQPKVPAKIEAGGCDELLCTLCGLKFSNLGQLKKHSKVHRGEKRKKLVCGICEKELADKSSMEQHMAIHLDLKNFKCDHCGRLFRQRNNLVRHNRIHTGVSL